MAAVAPDAVEVSGLVKAGRSILSHADRAGAGHADRIRAEIAHKAGQMPGVNAWVEDEMVVMEGRGLLDRWLRDANLRNIGRAGR